MMAYRLYSFLGLAFLLSKLSVITSAGISNYGISPPAPLPQGDIAAVYDLLERVLPSSSSHFMLSFLPSNQSDCNTGTGTACFTLQDIINNTNDILSSSKRPPHNNNNNNNSATTLLLIQGTTAAELAAGVGYYLREYCNMTFGWPRGGGSHVFLPSTWPVIGTNGAPLVVSRSSIYSFAMNVCTLSYTMAWHSWSQWEAFLDWAVLSGINIMLSGLVGQEELQYRVFSKMGLNDTTIREWFFGPAYLAWGRGQNSHANGTTIGGPLPRSWMQSQWNMLQTQLLPRSRSLGLVSVLPAFQGVVPWELVVMYNDTANSSRTTFTGWLTSTDALFGQIADLWMQEMCQELNCTDHVYQMDGFFHNASSWGGGSEMMMEEEEEEAEEVERGSSGSTKVQRSDNYAAQTPTSTSTQHSDKSIPPAVPCIWSDPIPDTYLKGCVDGNNCTPFSTLQEAEAACVADATCGGVTIERSLFQIRSGRSPISYANETSYVIQNPLSCQVLPPDPTWLAIGTAAYQGIARTDPDAVWMYQGWALYVGGTGINTRDPIALSRFRGFITAPPQGKFLIVDMASNGAGEWREWDGLWNTPFIWTTLHTFGGADSIKGNLSLANHIPYDALSIPPPSTTTTSTTTTHLSSSSSATPHYQQNTTSSNSTIQVIGSGYTPEGFDQNPAYYELVQEAAFRATPVSDLSAWLVRRAHRRYGLLGDGYTTSPQENPEVTLAWNLLANSSYATDLSVTDGTGVGIIPGVDTTHFLPDRHTPTPSLCRTWQAWNALLAAAPQIPQVDTLSTYSYDLVNLGREILAQLSTPLSQNFSDAIYAEAPLNATRINQTAFLYSTLLLDLDTLVSTEFAFLLGPFLQDARALGEGNTDCVGTVVGDFADCGDFLEWNARCQITTWYPTRPNATEVYPRDTDYAKKHWSGLIRDYYYVRVTEVLQAQALIDASASPPAKLNMTAVALGEARLAYTWTTATSPSYPVVPTPGFVDMSQRMLTKYAPYFLSCV